MENMKRGGLTAGPHLPGSPARPLLCFAPHAIGRGRQAAAALLSGGPTGG